MHHQRKLAAILFSDISGYTRLMGSNEADALSTLELNRRIHLDCLKMHDGHLVKEIGDGMLARFDSATQAVECALEIQRRAIQHDLHIRVGIHEGDVVISEHDVFGDGVNIASRIESAAVPGSVLLSEKVNDNLKNLSHLTTTLLGEFMLKNDSAPRKLYALSTPPCTVPEPSGVGANPHIDRSAINSGKSLWIIAASAALVAIVLWLTRWPAKPVVNPGDIVLAIMPFDDLRPEEEGSITAEALAAGLSEKMSDVPGIVTISSHETFKAMNVKGASFISIPGTEQKAPDVNATHFLAASVGSQLDIELIGVSNDRVLWKVSYLLDDPARTIDDISRSVARELGVSQTTGTRGDYALYNPVAYDLYTEALNLFHKREREANLLEAIRLLVEADEIDPENPNILGLLAISYATGTERWYFDFDSTKHIILDYAESTLNLDPDDAYGLLSMGTYYMQSREYELSRDWYNRAFEAAPDKGITSQALGELALFTGDRQTAYDMFKRASKASPRDKTVLEHIAHAEMANGYRNEAKKQRDKLKDWFAIDYNHVEIGFDVIENMIDQKYDSVFHLMSLKPDSIRGGNYYLLWGVALVEVGDTARYLNYMSEIDTLSLVSEHIELLWLMHNGNAQQKEQALEMVSDMFKTDRFGFTFLLQTYPFQSFHTLTSDPEFQRIGREYGITFRPNPYFKIQRELSGE